MVLLARQVPAFQTIAKTLVSATVIQPTMLEEITLIIPGHGHLQL
jgi:hypothetical protein